MPPQQPQNPSTLNSGPNGSLDPNYGFIFNGQNQSRRRLPFRLPGGNNLTRITLLVVIAGAVLGVLIIILSSVFGSNGVNTKQVNDIIARAQEITRVSTLVSQQSRDGAVLNLAATTSTALTSDEKQLIDYSSKYAHQKLSAKDFNLYLNRKTDAQIQAASSTNTLSAAYYGYLKNQLIGYQNAVRAAAADNPATIRPLLQTALSNAQTILSAQEIATAQ